MHGLALIPHNGGDETTGRPAASGTRRDRIQQQESGGVGMFQSLTVLLIGVVAFVGFRYWRQISGKTSVRYSKLKQLDDDIFPEDLANPFEFFAVSHDQKDAKGESVAAGMKYTENCSGSGDGNGATRSTEEGAQTELLPSPEGFLKQLLFVPKQN